MDEYDIFGADSLSTQRYSRSHDNLLKKQAPKWCQSLCRERKPGLVLGLPFR